MTFRAGLGYGKVRLFGGLFAPIKWWCGPERDASLGAQPVEEKAACKPLKDSRLAK
jgi:hypothetical protein